MAGNGPGTGRRPSGSRRPNQDDLLGLIGGIYEAGVDHSRWPQVMRQTMRVIGNSGSHLLLTDYETGRISRSIHVNMPDEMIEEYNNEIIHICPRMESRKAHPERDIFWD